MAVYDPNNLNVGQYVCFSCQHPTDQNIYEGKVIGKVTFDIAKTIEADLIPYYREVAKIVTNLPPYETLTYLVIEYSQGENSGLKLARAIEWIDPASLVVSDPDAYFDIRIFYRPPSFTVDETVDLLKSHGFVASLIQ